MFALIGAAIVGSGTTIASVIRSNQRSHMKEECGVAVMLEPHEMRKAREKMSQSGAKRIDEASAPAEFHSESIVKERKCGKTT